MLKGQRKQTVNGKQNCQKMDKSLVENQDTQSKINKGRNSKVIPKDQDKPSSSGLREKRQRKVKKSQDFVYPLLKRRAYYVRKKSSKPDKNKPLQPNDLQFHKKVSMAESCAKDHNGHPFGKHPEKSVNPETVKHYLRRVKTFVTGKENKKIFGKSQTTKAKTTNFVSEQASTMELKEEPKYTQKETEKKTNYLAEDLGFFEKLRRSARKRKTSKKDDNIAQVNKKVHKDKSLHIKKQAQNKLNGNPINESSSSDTLKNAETNDLQSDSRKTDATNMGPRKRGHASQCSMNHPETSSMSGAPVLETQDNSAKKRKTWGVANKTRKINDTSKTVKWTSKRPSEKTTPMMKKEKRRNTPNIMAGFNISILVDDFLMEEFFKKFVIKKTLKFSNKQQLIEPTNFKEKQLLSLFVDDRLFYMNKEFTGVEIHMADENEINRILKI